MVKYNITPIKGDEATLDQLKQFAAVPFFIPWYRSPESHKVFPLFLTETSDLNASRNFAFGLVSKNPYFEHTDITYFIADDGAKPVGRIAAFVDHHYNKEHGEPIGGIGMFECIKNPSLAEQLLTEAAENLKYNGCTKIDRCGKFDANGEIGLLVDGFDKDPYFMEPYNAPYYQEYFEKNGFTKINDWYSVHVVDTSSEQFQEYMNNARRVIGAIKNSPHRGKVLREATIRNVDFSKFDDELKILDLLYNGEWGKGNHPQFAPMTPAELKKLASDIKLIDREEYVQVVEYMGEPIGIAASVPNINEKIADWDRRHPDYLPSPNFLNGKDLLRDGTILWNALKGDKKEYESLRVLILGVKEEYRHKGVESALYLSAFEAAEKNGIKRASFSELADVNPDIVIPLTKMGPIAMTWRVYGRDL
jgi:GNAT superfamily N-acetyltransferase